MKTEWQDSVDTDQTARSIKVSLVRAFEGDTELNCEKVKSAVKPAASFRGPNA